MAIGVPMAHLWHIHGLPFAYSWCTFGVSMAYLGHTSGIPSKRGTGMINLGPNVHVMLRRTELFIE